MRKEIEPASVEIEPDCEEGVEQSLTDDAVTDYLYAHPDFLAERPDLLRELILPSRWSDDKVVDMQQYLVDMLRDELAGMRDCAQEVIETSRLNLATQSRTHAAVLALIAAEDLEAFARVISEDLPVLLDVDIVVVGLEADESFAVVAGGLSHLAPGTVDRLIGTGQDVALYREIVDDGNLFGPAATLIRSAAFGRLKATVREIDGVFGLGCRVGGVFHPGQGSELFRFLARIVESCLKRLLPVAD